MDEVREDFLVKSDEDRTVPVLSLACRNYHNYSVYHKLYVVNKVLLSLFILYTLVNKLSHFHY